MKLYTLKFKLAFIAMLQLALIFSRNVNAQKTSNCIASPFAVTINNGGQKLDIIAKGNRSLHWTETVDGYALMKNEKGVFEYVFNEEGKFKLTGELAGNNRTKSGLVNKNGFLKLDKANTAQWKGYLDSKFKDVNSKQQIDTKTAVKSYTLDGDMPSVGNVNVLCILISYPDLSSSIEVPDFENLFNTDNYKDNNSFAQFYRNTSCGKLNMNVDVKGWYTAKNNYQYYGYQNGFGPSFELAAEAVQAAEADGVDFSKYDNDGDGYVDGVIIIHSGIGAEQGGQDQYIWSHQSTMARQDFDNVHVSRYCINPEIHLWGEEERQVGIGVLAHEFGHILGLPDLYDLDGSSAGAGSLDIMSSGSWGGSGYKPTNFSAWSRVKLNWIEPVELKTSESDYNISIKPASGSEAAIYKLFPSENTNQYFLLENRQQTGNDIALPSHGLAVWHIDEDQVFSGNTDENHKMVDIEEADGLDQLDKYENGGDDGDLFPGTADNTSFSKESYPSSNLYNQTLSGISLSDITEQDGVINLTVQVKKNTFSLLGELIYGRVLPETSVSAELKIKNNSSEILSIENVSCPDGFSADWTGGDINANEEKSVMFTFSPKEVKDYKGSVLVSSSSGEENTIEIKGEGFRDDNYEVNNEFSQAYDLSAHKYQWLSDIDGLGQAADEDWYKINVPQANSKIKIECVYTSLDGDLHLRLYDSENNMLAYAETWGDTEIMEYICETEGDYYFKVYSYYDDYMGNEYDLRWDIPGFSLDGDLNFDKIIAGTSAEKKFSIVNSGAEELEITEIICPQDFEVNWKAGTIAAGNQQEVLLSFTPKDGILYEGELKVVAASGEYKLISVSGEAYLEDGYEENDYKEQAYDLSGNEGKWLSEINGPGYLNNQDVYKIQLDVGRKVIVNCKHSYEQGNIDIGVSNSYDSFICFSESESDMETMSWMSEDDGIYYIYVYGADMGNKYDLKIDYEAGVIALEGDLNFGDILIGESAQKQLKITNTGSEDLNVESINYPAGYLGDWDSGVLVPGASHSLNISFTPVETIEYAGEIQVVSDAKDGDGAISVTGFGISREFTLSESLSFGNTDINTEKTDLFSISNNGNANLTVTEINYPEGFRGDWNSGIIEAGKSKQVNLTFSPVKAKDYSGDIVLVTNAFNGEKSLAVSGLGTDRVIVAASACEFGNIDINATKEKSITISNTGNDILNISDIECPEYFAVEWTQLAIAPGETKDLTISFSPIEETAYSGSLNIISDALSGSATVSLSGAGVDVFSEDNVNIVVYSESCPDLNDGEIVVESKKADVNIEVNPGGLIEEVKAGSSVSFSNLSAGEYSIRASSGSSERVYGIRITEPEAISMTSIANGHDVEIVITGGVPPYEVNLSGSYKYCESGIVKFSNLPNGTYPVYVTDKNECTLDVKDRVIISGNFYSYPNPVSNGILNIVCSSDLQNNKYTVSFTDMSGRRQLLKSINLQNGKTTISLGNLATGMYIMQIENETSVLSTQKIMLK